MKKDIDTPETNSRIQTAEAYLKDVKSKNQPCKTVVPSSWAQKLERKVKLLEKKLEGLVNPKEFKPMCKFKVCINYDKNASGYCCVACHCDDESFQGLKIKI
jgi:hypothetical protein